MEDDEDEAMKLLQMKIQLAEMTANKKKKTVQTAAVSEVQRAPCVEAVQTAWQSVRRAVDTVKNKTAFLPTVGRCLGQKAAPIRAPFVRYTHQAI